MKKFLSALLALLTLALCACGDATANSESQTEEAATTEATTAEATTAATTAKNEETTGESADMGPKKYFTLSFDDGITQDARIIEILKKYGLYCCTFNINTGLCGADWAWVGQQFNRPDVTHKRYTKKELKSGIYDGFDVAVHTLTHPSLKNFDNQPDKIVKEVEGDADGIEKLTGTRPVGMAWPGGDTEYTEKTVQTVYEKTSIRYARAVTPTYSFDLPEYFLTWYPTCSISDAQCLDLAKQFLRAECTSDMLFYVWGHGYELDLFNSYDKFEQLVKYMAEADDVVCVTNTEFYHLFKDSIPSWKDGE